MDDTVKVGLALSGGGSLGAYQAGMTKALAESGIPVHEVAGASIGALNGVVLACAPSLRAGAQRLETLWLDEAPFYLRLIISSMLTRLGPTNAEKLLVKIRAIAAEFDLPVPDLLNEDDLLLQGPLRHLLSRCLDEEELAKGLPLYVSVYESVGDVGDLLRWGAAELGLVDTPKSTFKHLQALSVDEQKECLTASMALPIIFKGRTVEGKLFSDGGQGGWQSRQGNTPVGPLVQAGCDLVIVMHTSGGSPWDRRDWPDAASFIEIRPKHERSAGLFGDLFETDREVLSSWIAQGYEDARGAIHSVQNALHALRELRSSKMELEKAEGIRLNAERSREAAEARLEDALTDFKKRI